MFSGQIATFCQTYGFDIELQDQYYTFSTLLDAPTYSVAGDTYLGAPCIKTFEGPPWEVMRQNKLVYNFVLDQVVPILSVKQTAHIYQTDMYFLSDGMLMAGTLTDAGKVITDYAAHYIFNVAKFKYSEIDYDV